MRFLWINFGLCVLAATASAQMLQEQELPAKPLAGQPAVVEMDPFNTESEKIFVDVAEKLAEIKPFQAKIHILRKDTDVVETLTLGKGEEVAYGALRIKTLNCVEDVHGEYNNDAVYLTVMNAAGDALFDGWIYSKYSGYSALEHPVIDLRVLNCAR